MIDPQRARDELGALVAGPLSDDDILDRYARVVWNSLTEPGDAAAGILTGSLGAFEALARVRRGDISDSILRLECFQLLNATLLSVAVLL